MPRLPTALQEIDYTSTEDVSSVSSLFARSCSIDFEADMTDGEDAESFRKLLEMSNRAYDAASDVTSSDEEMDTALAVVATGDLLLPQMIECHRLAAC